MGINKEKILAVTQLFLFNIIFATWDQYSDVRFAYVLFSKGHTYWASAVITPVIINFVFTLYAWYYLEPRNQKLYTWIFLILQLWPQFCAFRIITLILRNKSEWKKNKSMMERSVCLLEPFLESIPQTIILTILFYLTNCQKFSCKENNRLIIGNNMVIFAITYASSILGAGSGLVKFLGTGPIKTLPSVFPNWQYFVTMISVLGTIIAKGLLLVIITLHSATFFSLVVPPRSLSYVETIKCERVTVMEPLLFNFGTNNTSHGGYAFKVMDRRNTTFDLCKDSTGNDIGVCAFYCGDWTVTFHLLSVIAWVALFILPQGKSKGSFILYFHVGLLFSSTYNIS